MPIINGTFYSTHNVAVIQLLERLIFEDARVRIFYGDTDTGRDWGASPGTGHDYDRDGCTQEGYVVGTDFGNVKLPATLRHMRSCSERPILDAAIVKIAWANRNVGGVLYEHPTYHRGCAGSEARPRPDGLFYSTRNEEVVQALERLRDRDVRVRIFFGDIETGLDWGEDWALQCSRFNDGCTVEGYVTGHPFGPVLLPGVRHHKGCAGAWPIPEAAIVKIEFANRAYGGVLYQHRSYARARACRY